MEEKTWNGHQKTRDPTMLDDDLEDTERFQEETSAEMERNEDMADNNYKGAAKKDECSP